MAKAMDDELWEKSFVEIASLWLDGRGNGPDDRYALAEALTTGKFTHAAECKTFEQLYQAEAAGIVHGSSEMLGAIMLEFCRADGFRGEISKGEAESSGRQLANLVAAALTLGRIGREVPQIHICATLHAAVRFNKNRQFDPNDMEDFRHAASALPYFQGFLTERSLCHLVTTKPHDLARQYEATVVSKTRDIIAYLETLDRDLAPRI